METKTCSKCNESKPVSEFGRNRRKKDGLQVWCRACSTEFSKAYNREHREEITAWQRLYRETPRGRATARRASRKWNEEHREELLEYYRAYHRAHRGDS